jgi:hypothetical protein
MDTIRYGGNLLTEAIMRRRRAKLAEIKAEANSAHR